MKLGTNLRDRVTAYHVVAMRGGAPSASYLAALVAHEGREVEIDRTWRGPTGLPFAYNVVMDGKAYHVPALFLEEETK